MCVWERKSVRKAFGQRDFYTLNILKSKFCKILKRNDATMPKEDKNKTNKKKTYKEKQIKKPGSLAPKTFEKLRKNLCPSSEMTQAGHNGKSRKIQRRHFGGTRVKPAKAPKHFALINK